MKTEKIMIKGKILTSSRYDLFSRNFYLAIPHKTDYTYGARDRLNFTKVLKAFGEGNKLKITFERIK